jgi:alpha-galactosidase
MEHRSKTFLKKELTLLSAPFVASALIGLSAYARPSVVHASPTIPMENNGVAQTPFIGWSSRNSIGYNPTVANIEAQAQVEASKLKSSGYTYVLLDDFWYLNPSTTIDANGYWVNDGSKFPNGLSAVASYVHSPGLKFGMYLIPCIPMRR